MQQYQAGKTLWDWLNLLGVLGIPVAVAFGSLWFTAQQSKTQDAENEDNQRERALQEYIDKISDLLLNHNLRGSTLSIDSELVIIGSEIKLDKEVQTIARARTLTVLSNLDGKRKKNVLQFLYELGLLDRSNPIISLEGADLSRVTPTMFGVLEIDLPNADLSGANLVGANFQESDLSRANLFGANLLGAIFFGAYLIEADLAEANIGGANFRFARLRGANFRGAIGTTPEQLAQAKSLEGTTMPDGSTIERPGTASSFASQVLAIWQKEGRLKRP